MLADKGDLGEKLQSFDDSICLGLTYFNPLMSGGNKKVTHT